MVFDNNGYLKLTDFGISKEWTPEIVNKTSNSGTFGYMAPEVLFNKNHSMVVDYFAVGVLAYECMTGKKPFKGPSN